MKYIACVFPLVLGAVAHGELIEYTVSGNGTIMYMPTEANSTPNALGSRQWNSGFDSDVESTYTYRFYADTDNVVSDGNGGYYVPIEAFHYEFGDGSVGAVNEEFAFHVAANGSAGFMAVDWIFTDYLVAQENIDLVSEGFLSGYDPSMELSSIQTILAQQGYVSGSILPIYNAELGAAGFSIETINFAARFVDSIPPVPGPGVFGMLGVGGLLVARRRR